MNTDPRIVKGLSHVMKALLSSINMYFLHYRMQEFWGYQGLAGRARETSTTSMSHSLQLMERILFLENKPNIVHSDEINVGRTCEEQLSNQYKSEIDISGLLRDTQALCIEQRDYISKALLDAIGQSNKMQIDWLENQFREISELGLQDYLAGQLEVSFRRAGDFGIRTPLPASMPG